MARLHKEYNKFNKEIKLTDARKESLLKSRKSLREKIKKYFKEKNLTSFNHHLFRRVLLIPILL
jgi:hypothetical protein